jgi:hypothetical protein
MSKRTVSILLWALAAFLTVFLAVYQRMTGPTYPIRGTETIKGKTASYKLIRSNTEFTLLPVKITVPDRSVTGKLSYKRFKTNDPWTEIEMRREGDLLLGEIPGQPAAGKMEYIVRITFDGETFPLNKGKTIVARFKGDVPFLLLITHIIFMFVSILLGLRTGMETLRKDSNYIRLVNWTLGVTFIGGMILGPIVQQYAFGDLWTGFPFGMDLTDNKLLIAVILWLFAFFLKKKSKWWALAATVVMVIVYLIPHSVMGSELNYNTGKMRNKYTFVSQYKSAASQVSLKMDKMPGLIWHSNCFFIFLGRYI